MTSSTDTDFMTTAPPLSSSPNPYGMALPQQSQPISTSTFVPAARNRRSLPFYQPNTAAAVSSPPPASSPLEEYAGGFSSSSLPSGSGHVSTYFQPPPQTRNRLPLLNPQQDPKSAGFKS